MGSMISHSCVARVKGAILKRGVQSDVQVASASDFGVSRSDFAHVSHTILGCPSGWYVSTLLISDPMSESIVHRAYLKVRQALPYNVRRWCTKETHYDLRMATS